jgi:hypothetical protein
MFGPFPSPFSYYFAEEMHPRPLLELRLISVSASIRNKPDWHLKRRDPEIVARWQREAVAQHITPIQFKYVMDELDYYEKLRSDTMEVASVDGVWKASSLFPEALSTEFSRLVAKLADIPDHQKDWHPGSDGRVLDLVHPGLYLFVSGKTRTIQPNQPDDAPSVPTSLPRREGRHEFASNEYQWIPTAIAVDTNGKVTFLSYINNLHPGKNIPLYGVLSDMLAHTLPMFERVLTFLSSPLGPKINLRGFNWYEDSNYPKQLEGETDNDYWERVEVWENTRPIKPIPLKDYVEPPKVDPVVLRDCKLQVIVKIQEIHLTPEKPVYDGGVWHIEGMENERIVSSAIYYYDSSNITECTLSFRQAVGDPYYEQNDNRGVMEVFGLEDGQPLVQNLGSVVTKVFPFTRLKVDNIAWTRTGMAKYLSTPSIFLRANRQNKARQTWHSGVFLNRSQYTNGI